MPVIGSVSDEPARTADISAHLSNWAMRLSNPKSCHKNLSVIDALDLCPRPESLRPVLDIALKQQILEIGFLQTGTSHIVERDDTDNVMFIQHR